MAIEDIINHVDKQDFSKAGPTFAEIMATKVTDALEQEKIAVAGQVFNQATDGESDDQIVANDAAEEEDTLEDQEVQDAIADEIENPSEEETESEAEPEEESEEESEENEEDEAA